MGAVIDRLGEALAVSLGVRRREAAGAQWLSLGVMGIQNDCTVWSHR